MICCKAIWFYSQENDMIIGIIMTLCDIVPGVIPTGASCTPKFVTPTAPLHIDIIIVEGVPLSPQQTRLAPTRHFRFIMSMNEYWKNSDNWIIRCHKFSSYVLISSKVSFFYVIKKSSHNIYSRTRNSAALLVRPPSFCRLCKQKCGN